MTDISRRSLVVTMILGPVLDRLGQAHHLGIEGSEDGHRGAFVLIRSVDPDAHNLMDGPVQIWERNGRRLMVWSLGNAPEPLGRKWFAGEGLGFSVARSRERDVLLYGTSEADFRLTYTIRDATLVIVQHTYDPEQGATVPFIEHAFDLLAPQGPHARRILLRSGTASRDLPQLDCALSISAEAVLSDGRVDVYNDLERGLFLVRNAGLTAPDAARSVLSRHRDDWWCDGALGESWTTVMAELDEVTAARHSSASEWASLAAP